MLISPDKTSAMPWAACMPKRAKKWCPKISTGIKISPDLSIARRDATPALRMLWKSILAQVDEDKNISPTDANLNAVAPMSITDWFFWKTHIICGAKIMPNTDMTDTSTVENPQVKSKPFLTRLYIPAL